MEQTSTEELERQRAAINAQRDELRVKAAAITEELNRRAVKASAAKKLAALSPEELAELRQQMQPDAA